MIIRRLKRIIQTILFLLLFPVIVGTFWLTVTESGLHWAYDQASLYLPGEVMVGNMEGRLIGPITISQFSYHYEGSEIRVQRLKLDWSPLSLLGARIDITQLHVLALDIARQKASSETQQSSELPEIYLPWQLSLRDVVIDDINLREAENVYSLSQFRIEATTLFNRLNIETLNVLGDSFEMDVNGSMTLNNHYAHNLKLSWRAQLPGSEEVLRGKGSLQGNLEALTLQQQLSGALKLNLQGELKNLLQEPSWQATIDASQFDTRRLHRSWPPVKGKLKLQASGTLTTATVSGEAQAEHPELNAFESTFKLRRLQHNLIKIDSLDLYLKETESRLAIKGDWKPPFDGDSVSGDVDLELNWENLRWPLQQSAWFNSASGAAQLTGNSNQYSFDLTTDRPWPQVPPSSWRIVAHGNQQGLDIKQLDVNILDGVISSRGRLDWTELLNWQASTTMRGINPGAQWPDWPGQLDATLISTGKIENGAVSAEANIENLKGQLRGNPLSLASRLQWEQDELTLHQLELESGSSSLKARGRVGDSISLDWSMKADDIGNWLPRTRGAVEAHGQLGGTRDQPDVKASFTGLELGLQEINVGTVAGTISADINRWKDIRVELSSKALSYRDYSLESLEVKADAGSLQADIVSDPLSAQLRFEGGITDNNWRGRLQSAFFQSKKFNDWELLNPGDVLIGPEAVRTGELCWISQQTRLCSQIQGQGQRWDSKVSLKQFPLELLNFSLPPDFRLKGTTDASTSISFDMPDRLSGNSKIEFSEGQLIYLLGDGDTDTLDYRNAVMNLNLDSQRLQADASVTMSNNDQVIAELTLPNLNLLRLDIQKQALEARVSVNIRDYSILETLIPEVRDIKGQMQLSLTAGGTLDQPRLSGNLTLLEATARIPRLGLTIEDINLTGRSDHLEQFKFDLSARSGGGLLNINGQTLLDTKAGWPTTLTIKGDSVEVSRIPEARVQVSPDLRVGIRHRNIDISGDLQIPYARLQPIDFARATRVSDDVIIIGKEQQTEEKWLISSKVRVVLGNRVHFSGFGFDGRLEGNLLLEDRPGQPTSATGDIRVAQGRYKAYGQNLDIEQGYLLFTGGPVVNPGLDLRAVRRVNEVIAGLKVRGTLSQPQIELFSVPAMGQTNALSYLLLGRPLENASNDEGSMMARAALALSLSGGDRLARTLGDRFGLDEMRVESNDSGDQASLVIGRYLSPKLYVSYGVGLIDSFNTLNFRYQLSSKWQLKGESGETQGADLLYTIER